MDNKWIPVEDKLPEQDLRYKGRKVMSVLVSTKRHTVHTINRMKDGDKWYWGRIKGIIAWQPLPKPYYKPQN